MKRPQTAPGLPAHLLRPGGVDASDLPGLHLQASEWHEAQGQPEAAIRHALAGGAWSRAAYLIDQEADAALGQGRSSELAVWLEGLPQRCLDAWPRLLIVQAYLHLPTGEIERAQTLVDRAAQRLQHPQAPATIHLPASDHTCGGLPEALGHLEAVRAELALHTGRIELALELARQALPRLPLDRPFWRSLAAGCVGTAQGRAGKLTDASRYFAQARTEAGLAGSRESGLRFGIQQLDCLWALGRPQEGEKVCQELIQGLLARSPGQEACDPSQSARLYARWGRLLAELGQAEEAQAAALEALVMAGEDPAARAEAVLALARIYLALGMVEAARQALTGHPEWLAGQPQETATLRIEVALSRRQSSQAGRVFSEIGLDPESSLADQPVELRRLAARWLLAQGRARPAVQRLLALHERQTQACEIETLLLLALAYQAIEAEQASLDALSQALFLAAPQGWIGPFLRYGREMARLLYKAGAQDIQPEFIARLLDRMS